MYAGACMYLCMPDASPLISSIVFIRPKMSGNSKPRSGYTSRDLLTQVAAAAVSRHEAGVAGVGREANAEAVQAVVQRWAAKPNTAFAATLPSSGRSSEGSVWSGLAALKALAAESAIETEAVKRQCGRAMQ